MTLNILKIDASMRKKGSYSRALGQRLVSQIKTKTPSIVKERDLADGIPFINEAWINANFTDVAERTAEQRSVLSFSDALISELDFVSDYIHHVLGFMGIEDVTIIDSSGIGRDEEKVIANARASIDTFSRANGY
jgi:FMN-dependent NADH-azoreductase